MENKDFDIFVCPECKGKLKYVEDGHIFICTECGRKYPIIDGIPIFLSDKEAEDVLHNMDFNSNAE